MHSLEILSYISNGKKTSILDIIIASYWIYIQMNKVIFKRIYHTEWNKKVERGLSSIR